MLDCCCGLSQKRMGGEECGTIVLRSHRVTLMIWRECQGERAASRKRNKRLYPPRYKITIIYLKKSSALTVWQTDWCLYEGVCGAGVCVYLVRRSSQSCRSCCVLQATCILSLWLPAQQQFKYNFEARKKLNKEQPLSTKFFSISFRNALIQKCSTIMGLKKWIPQLPG